MGEDEGRDAEHDDDGKLGPPLGQRVEFEGAEAPAGIAHHGRLVTVRPVDPRRDASALYELSHAPTGDPAIWTYLYDGPYPNLASFSDALHRQADSDDPLFFTVERAGDGAPLGVLALMAIVPEHGTIEIGHVWFSAQLKRTAMATEAVYLIARHAFEDLGYRRLEWKCNALNEPSRRAAVRLGFEFEGVFHNHRVVKGRNRDTAWFAITEGRWPAVRSAFVRWLEPSNFDAHGGQIRSLRELARSAEADSLFK